MNDIEGATPPSATDFDTAFEVFSRRNFSSVAVVAGTVAASRSVGEKVTKKAMSRAHREWAKISLLDQPDVWVRRVAINLATRHSRHWALKPNSVLQLGPSARHPAETRRGDPAVWAALDALTVRQRAAVALCDLEGRPIEELAEILDISVSVATSDLYQARAKLAEICGETDV